MEEASDELQEVHIIAGNQLELKQRVSSLIVALLDIEDENKDAVDMSYEQIMKKVNRSKDKEKGRIISYFGNMTIDERKIEDAFKNYKLGRWNVGQQKGLFQYDPKTYERERNEMIAELYDENPDMTDAGVETLDIFELDKLDAVVETDDYNPVMPDFGPSERIVGAFWATLSFDVLLSGGGAPLGTPPNHGVLSRGCGVAQTVSAGASASLIIQGH
jgi:hypothetical protein